MIHTQTWFKVRLDDLQIKGKVQVRVSQCDFFFFYKADETSACVRVCVCGLSHENSCHGHIAG